MANYQISDLPIRIQSKIEHNLSTGCWMWIAALNNSGYGQIGLNKKLRQATHVVLEHFGIRRTTQKPNALHHCDTPACVNPAHLYWGTQYDNNRDMNARGRQNLDGIISYVQNKKGNISPHYIYVCWGKSRKKYMANIHFTSPKRNKYIGRFSTKEEARQACNDFLEKEVGGK